MIILMEVHGNGVLTGGNGREGVVGDFEHVGDGQAGVRAVDVDMPVPHPRRGCCANLGPVEDNAIVLNLDYHWRSRIGAASWFDKLKTWRTTRSHTNGHVFG